MPNRPKGWKKAIPTKLRLAVWTRENGICHITGEFVRYQDCDIDHFPAAAHRPWNDETQDTDPPQLDPRYLYPIKRGEVHRTKSKRDAGFTAKCKRLDKKNGRVEDHTSRWPKRKIPNRGFRKRTR